MSGKASNKEVLLALARNPQLVKVMIANGLLMVAKMVAMILVLPAVRTRLWSHNMVEYQSIVSLFLALTAVVTSSPFGRFSDKCGRRVAGAVLGVVSFLPSWSVLVCGLNETGLYANSVATVISGIGVQSNVLLLLACDVTDPADREVAFGAFFSVSLLVNFLLMGLPSLLLVTLAVFSSSSTLVMGYQVVLSLLYFLVLASVRVPAKPAPEAEEASPEAETGAFTARLPCRACAATACSGASSMLAAPLSFCRNRDLRNLALATFLVAFSGDLLMDVGGQFFRETLGLIPYGTLHQQQVVSVMSTLPPQLLVLPGYIALGLISRRCGSLRLFLLLVPISAALQAAGACMILVPEMWFVGVVTVTQAYGELLQVPLQVLVTDRAPVGQEGEVMGFMGGCQQLANMLGNLAIASVTPLLQRSGLRDPLWVYYPAAAFLVLLSAIPAAGLLAQPAAAKGAASNVNEVQEADAENNWSNGNEEVECPPEAPQPHALRALSGLGQQPHSLRSVTDLSGIAHVSSV